MNDLLQISNFFFSFSSAIKFFLPIDLSLAVCLLAVLEPQ